MIPRIIHRTLPAVPSDDVERIWNRVVANSPGWERRTYQSPRDPADWPITGHLFGLCHDKAEESDLVRLEALWVHGGVYLDSDMELTQPLEWVVEESCAIGWEDEVLYGMALIAAIPRHPAVGALLDVLSQHVARNEGRSHLPTMATEVWSGRDDVRVLPRKALYPYGYEERNTEKATFDWSTDPEVFAVHYWHASWVK